MHIMITYRPIFRRFVSSHARFSSAYFDNNFQSNLLPGVLNSIQNLKLSHCHPNRESTLPRVSLRSWKEHLYIIDLSFLQRSIKLSGSLSTWSSRYFMQQSIAHHCLCESSYLILIDFNETIAIFLSFVLISK